jgi:hypothetical protein
LAALAADAASDAVPTVTYIWSGKGGGKIKVTYTGRGGRGKIRSHTHLGGG